MSEDHGAVPDPGAVPEGRPWLEVTVLRSGGLAGLVRRWSARIPDDGAPAARAARRIAAAGPPGGPDAPAPRGRDRFQWTVSCGPGTARYDEEARRADPDLDRLIVEVTRRPGAGSG